MLVEETVRDRASRGPFLDRLGAGSRAGAIRSWLKESS
jgi:hypothetical protein